MSDDSRPAIVRPFGLLGSAYEVDAAVMRKHRLGQVAAAVLAAVVIFRRQIGLPSNAALVLFIATFVALVWLSADIARNGKKL